MKLDQLLRNKHDIRMLSNYEIKNNSYKFDQFMKIFLALQFIYKHDL